MWGPLLDEVGSLLSLPNQRFIKEILLVMNQRTHLFLV